MILEDHIKNQSKEPDSACLEVAALGENTREIAPLNIVQNQKKSIRQGNTCRWQPMARAQGRLLKLKT